MSKKKKKRSTQSDNMQKTGNTQNLSKEEQWSRNKKPGSQNPSGDSGETQQWPRMKK